MDYLKRKYHKSKDVIFVCAQGVTLIYQEALADIKLFNKDFFPRFDGTPLDILFPGIIKKIEDEDYDCLIFGGDIIIIYKDIKYHFVLNNIPDRGIMDSIAEPDNLIGSRDGFIENIKTNTGLIRTRIKSSNMEIEELEIGRRTKTKLRVFSISDITNDTIKREIINYLEKIDVDSVINVMDITQYLSEKTIVPSINYTGSPDMASVSLLNGQVLILIDRLPVGIIAPITAFSLTLGRNDYEVPLFYAFLARNLVWIGIFLSIFGLGLLYSFLSFQSGNLSSNMVDILKVTQRGVVFGTFMEIMITLLIFEFYQIISHRSPGITVQTIVIILGGVLIGENTVSAGLVGVVVISVTALCYLVGYIVSNNIMLLGSISCCRMFILFCSLVFGIYGVALGAIVLTAYLYNKTSFGLPFTYPLAPFEFGDLKHFFITRSSSFYRERNKILKTKDKMIK